MRTQIEETIKQAIRIGNYLTGKSNEEENPASLPGKDEDPSNEKVVREVLSKQNVENSLEQYKRLNTGLERDWKNTGFESFATELRVLPPPSCYYSPLAPTGSIPSRKR